ncbi:hypothetical protein BJ508DRAFT_336679 [Ascobolus immersus RN42]|uniref:Uncharacterized protein n=1 Tax=Ascobolus immersus RN42 TaxID=1160509 RepID=A0A3N4H7P9_ASCIM|nr:hypothetical protein BJ508DRAFT_336679 [Ascobolus immersus RN42]
MDSEPLFNKPDDRLNEEDNARSNYQSTMSALHRMIQDEEGNLEATANRKNTDHYLLYNVRKIMRAWPGFSEKTKIRLCDPEHKKHVAALGALHSFYRNSAEGNRGSRNKRQNAVVPIPPFVRNVPVTILCVLPELHPNNMTLERLKLIRPDRQGVDGPLKPELGMVEVTFNIDGRLTLETLLDRFLQHQRLRSTFGYNKERFPMSLEMYQSFNPTDKRIRQPAPATLPLHDDYDFHMTVGTHGPDIAARKLPNGIWFHAVMHRYCPDGNTTDNIVRDAPVSHPLSRYANYKTYQAATWPLPPKLDPVGFICVHPAQSRLNRIRSRLDPHQKSLMPSYKLVTTLVFAPKPLPDATGPSPTAGSSWTTFQLSIDSGTRPQPPGKHLLLEFTRWRTPLTTWE